MDDELDARARQRIDGRTPQLLLLGADILACCIFVAAFRTYHNVVSRSVGTFIAAAWVGLMAFHVILTSFLQHRHAQAEGEGGQRLRLPGGEKPGRLELAGGGGEPKDDRLNVNPADKMQSDQL